VAADNLRIKETAVKEKRVWVRLTRACNNGCLFCLDSDCHDGGMAGVDEVRRELEAGRTRGGQRLILSGGEPTIHPEYARFVTMGRDLGYTWRQSVTNGRMFAYRRFADKVVEAGLNEATFSMHGHSAELHDRLVGVKGAFRQSLLGMRNLLGRIVVNVDVVLSKVNIPHLKEILEFYMAMGITEFDLLHMVPFGRAWNENREVLFYDPVKMAPHLRRAFALRKRKGIILWTNRLPAPFLEGCEDLIQDPHKMHDEVRGRLAMFEAWRDGGPAPVCKGERCPFCPMDGFCQALETAISAVGQAVSPPPTGRLVVADLRMTDAASLAEVAQVATGTTLLLPAEKGIRELLAGLPRRVVERVTLYQLTHEYLSEASERDLPLDELTALLSQYDLVVRGLPPCLGGRHGDDESVPPEVLGEDGKLDMFRFTDWYIAHRYFVKSLRCRGCMHDDTCKGIHINAALNYGLSVLRPVRTQAG
jgi:MoaA/NifB/PqqE/SkfB family radical SAM enzyme